MFFMKTGKPFEVLVFFAQTNKASSDCLAGILRYAATRSDWRLWLFDPISDQVCGNVLPPGRASGVITGNPVSELPSRIMPGNRLATVCVSGEIARAGMPAVLCDNDGLARAAADFFIKRGFRHFAFVESPKGESFSRERLDALTKALRGRCSSFSHISADSRDFDRWLARLPKPCALMGATDRFAKIAADHCRISGIRVPGEIAILGVDDEEIVCNFTSPTLSSISPAFETGGYMAAEMLDSIMRGKTRKARHRKYGIDGIVERDSTAISSSDVLAPAAVENFIRQHATSDITPEEAARAGGRDTARVRRAYREAYGRTICRGIQEARLLEVRKMLQKTRAPIDAIGAMCGFGNGLYLKALFKRRFGATMREWRKNHAR